MRTEERLWERAGFTRDIIATGIAVAHLYHLFSVFLVLLLLPVLLRTTYEYT